MPIERNNEEEREARLDELIEETHTKVETTAEQVRRATEIAKKATAMAKANRAAIARRRDGRK